MKNWKKPNLNDVMLDFDGTSLYPSAMWDEKSIYPIKESGFAFKPDKNYVYVKAFNHQTFNQDGDASALSKKIQSTSFDNSKASCKSKSEKHRS